MTFQGKERDKVERLLRLAIHTLSYSDWQSVSLMDAIRLPKSLENDQLIHKFFVALDQSHKDCVALLLATLSNLLLARRRSVLSRVQSAIKKESSSSRAPLQQSQVDRLVLSSFGGPLLFGSSVQTVLDEVKSDVRNIAQAPAPTQQRAPQSVPFKRPAQPSSSGPPRKKPAAKSSKDQEPPRPRSRPRARSRRGGPSTRGAPSRGGRS